MYVCMFFFNPKDIKRMHRQLCERYSIDHDPIDISFKKNGLLKIYGFQ